MRHYCLVFLEVFIFLALHNIADAESLALSAHPDQEEIVQAINSSASYLMDAALENGMFKYRINMNPEVKVMPKYNMLRHAGTIYAMAMHYGMQPDKRMHSAIIRTGSYLRQSAIGPVADQSDMMAVWSQLEGGSLQAKLGGTGLGLAPLLSIETIEPGFTPLADLRKLGRFVLFMQKKDGGFHSKFIPSKGGRQDNWESLYYPGEAALGLVMLYEKDPDRIWLQAAANALMYLARARQFAREVPADHWALIATAKLITIPVTDDPFYSKELLRQHAIQIVGTILKGQCMGSFPRIFYGGFAGDGRVTPTATRIEGLIAARSFLPETWKKTVQLDLAIKRGVEFLLRAQITEGPFKGAFPRACAMMAEDNPQSEKFNRRASEVRIDYVQHALSALIGYAKMQE